MTSWITRLPLLRRGKIVDHLARDLALPHDDRISAKTAQMVTFVYPCSIVVLPRRPW
jgi:hypothetical protein